MTIDTKVLWIAVVVIAIAISLFFSIKKRTVYKQLQRCMAEERWGDFERLLDGKLTSMLYPRYNRDYLRLNSYLLREDYAEANKLFDGLLQLKLPNMQRVDLVIKAFNYFVGRENRTRSKELLDEIMTYQGERVEPIKAECQLMYDTMILKRSDSIDALTKQIGEVDGAKRGRLEYLLALQYRNKGDMDAFNEHVKKAAEDSFAPGGVA